MERLSLPPVSRAIAAVGLLALSLALVSGARAGSLAGSLGWYDDQGEPRRCDELTAANPGLGNPDGAGEPCVYGAREDQQAGYENLPVCEDGVDNDSDELTDCADQDCFGQLRCGRAEWCAVESASFAGQAGDCGGDDGDAKCRDGEDNDSDGLFDCADPDCAFSFGTWSSVCQPHGDPVCPEHTCDAGSIGRDEGECGGSCAADRCQNGADDNGDGAVDCADPSCAYQDVCETRPESDEAKCQDGADNDRDGSYDCADPDCAGASTCWWAWSNWNPGNWAAAETDCGNGADDDGDGYYDCADSECSADYRCSPITNPVTAETAPWGWFDYGFCGNGADDDGDGATDCSDQDCQSAPACAPRPCAATEQDVDGNCAADNPYWGPSCNDRYDNDGDGAVDCNDPDCAGEAACGSQTVSRSEVSPDGVTVAWLYGNGYCVDGIDNDSNGLLDCWDRAACLGQDPACGVYGGLGAVGWPYDWRFPGGDPTGNGGDGLVATGYCGDGACNGSESGASCPSDCGARLSEAPDCGDGIDNDSDGAVDCGDSECAGVGGCGSGWW